MYSLCASTTHVRIQDVNEKWLQIRICTTTMPQTAQFVRIYSIYSLRFDLGEFIFGSNATESGHQHSKSQMNGTLPFLFWFLCVQNKCQSIWHRNHIRCKILLFLSVVSARCALRNSFSHSFRNCLTHRKSRHKFKLKGTFCFFCLFIYLFFDYLIRLLTLAQRTTALTASPSRCHDQKRTKWKIGRKTDRFYSVFLTKTKRFIFRNDVADANTKSVQVCSTRTTRNRTREREEKKLKKWISNETVFNVFCSKISILTATERQRRRAMTVFVSYFSPKQQMKSLVAARNQFNSMEFAWLCVKFGVYISRVW